MHMFINGPETFDEGAVNDFESLRDKPELLMEILEEMREYNKKPYGQVWKFHRCEYHEHEESAICKA